MPVFRSHHRHTGSCHQRAYCPACHNCRSQSPAVLSFWSVVSAGYSYHNGNSPVYRLHSCQGGCLRHHIPVFPYSHLMPMDTKFRSAGFFHHTRIRWFLQVLPCGSGCRFHHRNSGCRQVSVSLFLFLMLLCSAVHHTHRCL